MAEIDERIRALPRDELYKRSPQAKRLLEELLPIKIFSMKCVYAATEVEIEAFENDGPIDGLITWKHLDESTSEINLEVTFIENYEDALRREKLWKEGSVPAHGPIHRERGTREIIAQHPPRPYNDYAVIAKKIYECHKKKCLKNYPRGTILIIAFDDPTFFSLHCWIKLNNEIESLGGLAGWKGEVFLVNCGSNEVQFVA